MARKKFLNYTSEHPATMGSKNWKIADVTDSVLVDLSKIKEPGWHFENFTEDNFVAKDSGGFLFLENPSLAKDFDVEGLIDKHRKVGFGPNDTIISADFPIPRMDGISDEEALKRQKTSKEWYELMKSEISVTVPVVHGRNDVDIERHIDMYELDEKEQVCFGSNLAQAKARVYDSMKKGGQKPKQKGIRPSTTSLWYEAIDMMSVIRNNERPVFLLGAGGMNAAPIAALLGAKSVDATSWRLNAMMKKIFCTDHGRFINVGRKPNYEEDWATEFLKERLQDDYYPFAGMTFDELIAAFNLPGAAGTEVCKLHNIYELDRDAERLSDFEGDPTGLADMLYERFHSTWVDRNNLKVLHKAYNSIRGDATVNKDVLNYTR
tara:strand:+ start:8793 stop:9926 length:1134 start_codon:yes stop_codon:yes gene_type:complete